MKSCHALEPLAEDWTQICSLQNGMFFFKNSKPLANGLIKILLFLGRYQAGVVVMNGQIYAVGGCDAWTCLNTVEKYDPEDNAWLSMTPMTTARRGCGVVVFKGKLYVVGGHDGSRSLSSVEIFDPEIKQWTAGPPLTTCRANVGVAVVGSRLYACGGFTGKTFLNSVEYLEDSSEEWSNFVFKDNNSSEQLNGSSSEPSLSEHDNIQHSLSKCSLLSMDEPLVEVEEESHSIGLNGEVDSEETFA